MITLKTKEQISVMRDAGKITGEALLMGGEAVREGVSTLHIDTVADILRNMVQSLHFLDMADFRAAHVSVLTMK